MDYNQIFSWLSKIILFINVIFYSKGFFQNIKKKAFGYFYFYIVFVFLFQIIFFLFWYYKENNIFLSHFYFIIQFILLSFFFRKLFKNKIQKRINNFILIGVIFIIAFQYVYNPDLFQKFNLFEITLTSIPLIMYSVLHFYNILGKEKEYFYINSGVFIYLSGSTLLFVAGNYIVSSNSILNKSIGIRVITVFLLFQ